MREFVPAALILAVSVLGASAALADPAPADTTAAAAADGPIATGRDKAPPPPAPGQTPAVLPTAPPLDGPDGWLPGQDDKKIHGTVGAGFDSRGGHSYFGSAYGPIGDNGFFGISVSDSKLRW